MADVKHVTRTAQDEAAAALERAGAPSGSSMLASASAALGRGAVQRRLAARRASQAPQQGGEIQRKGLAGEGAAAEAEPGAIADGPGWLVPDEDPGVRDGQVRRSAFLAELHRAVIDTATQALGAEWSAAGCPYIESWFSQHADIGADALQRLVTRYSQLSAAEAPAAHLAAVCARLKGGIARWRGGEDVSAELAAAGLPAAAKDAAAPPPAGQPGAGAAAPQAKAVAGGSPRDAAPEEVARELGHGTALDGDTASRMGGAFGASFGDVRVHVDNAAAAQADNLNARAFTVGRHVAFAAGEYQPGTPHGDALLAHELAHVQQQDAPGTSGDVRRKLQGGDSPGQEHEEEADQAALGVLGRLYQGGRQFLGRAAERAGIALKTGYSLQRCPKDKAPAPRRMTDMSLAELNAIKADPAKHSFSEVAAANARSMMLEHQDAVDKTGTGTMQGNQCSTPAPAGVAKQDCTTYVLEVLAQTFKAQGRDADWQAVYNEAKTQSGGKFKGTELLRALETKAGWKAVFWSPDPRNPQDKTPEHPAAYNKVKDSGKYYGIDVDKDKSVVDYRPTDAGKSAQTANLDRLRRVPFGVIAARGGTHMTVLINGQVYEVHWDKPATDRDVLQATALEAWAWQSGVVVMPADELDKAWKE